MRSQHLKPISTTVVSILKIFFLVGQYWMHGRKEAKECYSHLPQRERSGKRRTRYNMWYLLPLFSSIFFWLWFQESIFENLWWVEFGFHNLEEKILVFDLELSSSSLPFLFIYFLFFYIWRAFKKRKKNLQILKIIVDFCKTKVYLSLFKNLKYF